MRKLEKARKANIEVLGCRRSEGEKDEVGEVRGVKLGGLGGQEL